MRDGVSLPWLRCGEGAGSPEVSRRRRRPPVLPRSSSSLTDLWLRRGLRATGPAARAGVASPPATPRAAGTKGEREGSGPRR